ncbi:hypothetical protein PCE31107_03009 [Pandoraea cepalis]|uniref:Uncharacterized protein n=2 Tax=Pandoraea TaxID=93217 RepID=A0A5E4XIH2_9BURK|nr:hypothetical protein PCE31107_03009 [Pandoraea cepalis]VVE36086.1 hypothetical protein PTE31013_03930 [Pandoraea terrigena]
MNFGMLLTRENAGPGRGRSGQKGVKVSLVQMMPLEGLERKLPRGVRASQVVVKWTRC